MISRLTLFLIEKAAERIYIATEIHGNSEASNAEYSAALYCLDDHPSGSSWPRLLVSHQEKFKTEAEAVAVFKSLLKQIPEEMQSPALKKLIETGETKPAT